MFVYELDQGITLRLLQGRHAEELFEVTQENRYHLREWLPWLDLVQNEKDSARFIENSLRSFAHSGAFVCGIWQNCGLCGVIGYNRVDWEARAAFPGYWLAKSAEGQGIMTACCRALLDHAFNEYHLERVVITVATGNHKSQAIPDRLGFQRDGILPDAEWLYDHFVDHTVNVLLNIEHRNEEK